MLYISPLANDESLDPYTLSHGGHRLVYLIVSAIIAILLSFTTLTILYCLISLYFFGVVFFFIIEKKITVSLAMGTGGGFIIYFYIFIEMIRELIKWLQY